MCLPYFIWLIYKWICRRIHAHGLKSPGVLRGLYKQTQSPQHALYPKVNFSRGSHSAICHICTHVLCFALLKFIPFILIKACEHLSSDVPYCSPTCIILQSPLSVVISEFWVICIFGVFIICSLLTAKLWDVLLFDSPGVIFIYLACFKTWSLLHTSNSSVKCLSLFFHIRKPA